METNSKIYLSSPHFEETELNCNQLFFDSNLRNELDSPVNKFENDLENYLGEKSKIAVLSSGTSAIHLALIMSGVQRNDEVLCQSFTFSASANPIIYQGASPIFIDSEKETWNMCPVILEAVIKERIGKGKKPKAIIVVHLYGMPAKIDEIALIANKYEIKLIEDAAEALGSTYKNQKCGTFGDFGILSFNENKIITTSGGGALVCKTENDKQEAIFLATQARDKAPHYQHSQIGYNYRMSTINAAIGRVQIDVLNERIALRRFNHKFYNDIFRNTNGVHVFEEPNNQYFSNHWLSCVLFDETAKISSEALREFLDKENIESRPLWKPMHLQPVFNKYPYYGENISENLFINGICLPSGSNLTDEDRNRIKKAIFLAFQ